MQFKVRLVLDDSSCQRLESSIVIQGNLIHDVIISLVSVLIIRPPRSSNQGSFKTVVVGGGVLVGAPITAGRLGAAGTGSVVRALRGIIAKSYNKAAKNGRELIYEFKVFKNFS